MEIAAGTGTGVLAHEQPMADRDPAAVGHHVRQEERPNEVSRHMPAFLTSSTGTQNTAGLTDASEDPAARMSSSEAGGGAGRGFSGSGCGRGNRPEKGGVACGSRRTAGTSPASQRVTG